MTTLIIIHAECLDGATAGWVLKQKYPDALVHAARFGDDLPDVTGKDVIISDFSYTEEITLQILEKCNSLVLLDHHKTAYDRLAHIKHKNLRDMVFDMRRSGAGISWDWCFPNTPRPNLVDRVEDNDLWIFKYPDTRAFVEALRSFPQTVESIDMIKRNMDIGLIDIEKFVAAGAALRGFKDVMTEDTVRQAHEINFAGYKVFAANAMYFLSSDVANKLIRDRPFGVTYYEDDKGRWHISLRSNGFDVAKLAEQYGGGGHKNAAGITIDELPWK